MASPESAMKAIQPPSIRQVLRTSLEDSSAYRMAAKWVDPSLLNSAEASGTPVPLSNSRTNEPSGCTSQTMLSRHPDADTHGVRRRVWERGKRCSARTSPAGAVFEAPE
jgi:hypothetical protein